MALQGLDAEDGGTRVLKLLVVFERGRGFFNQARRVTTERTFLNIFLKRRVRLASAAMN